MFVMETMHRNCPTKSTRRKDYSLALSHQNFDTAGIYSMVLPEPITHALFYIKLCKKLTWAGLLSKQGNYCSPGKDTHKEMPVTTEEIAACSHSPSVLHPPQTHGNATLCVDAPHYSCCSNAGDTRAAGQR